MSGNKKFYLGFTFSPDTVVGLHCTHCYFGTLSARRLEQVLGVVDSFFKDFGPITMPRVAFTTPTIFGDGEERVRVLTTREGEAFNQFDGLRRIFADLGIISTKYPFRPHVSTKTLGLVNSPFYNYALVCDGEVVKGWTIGEQDA